MQPWQIKALKLESSALDSLSGFIQDHALFFLVGAIYLLLALLAWVLSGALRPKQRRPICRVRPTIIIEVSATPPPHEPPFYPFPPLLELPDCHDHDDLPSD
jgi:hypothetical protein